MKEISLANVERDAPMFAMTVIGWGIYEAVNAQILDRGDMKTM